MEIKNIEDVRKYGLFANSNFDNIINESLSVINNDLKNLNITDTPISPMMLDDEFIPIIFSNEVMCEYKKLVETINNPKTALEYSFVLLGKSALFGEDKCYFIDKLVYCNSNNTLNNRQTKIDQEKLNGAINFGIANGYDFISIGHTHPKIPIEEQNSTIAVHLPQSVINSQYLREPGLNLSLQDFISYESLYQYFLGNPKIRTCQTVIMFNGEVSMISKYNCSLNRFTLLMDQKGNEIYVSSKEEFNKSNKL